MRVLWVVSFCFVTFSLWGKSVVQFSLLQIQALGGEREEKKVEVDPRLQKRELKKLLKYLVKNYAYRIYRFVSFSVKKAKWQERIAFPLLGERVLYLTPRKTEKPEWVLLKVEIFLKAKKKKKKPKRILLLLQRVRYGSLFCLQLKQKKSSLFLVVQAQQVP